MLSKKEAKVIFDATKQNSSMFGIFYKILSETYSSMSKLEELVGQIMAIINSPRSLLFHVKSGLLYEYKALNESKETIKYVYKIVKQIEDSLDTKYLFPLASDSDTPMEGVCNKIVKEAQRPLKNKAETLAKEMLRYQNELKKNGVNKDKLNKLMLNECNIKFYKALSQVIKIDGRAILDTQTFRFKSNLNKWKKEQLRILIDKLTKMVPKENYYFAYNGNKINKISSKAGRQQAKKLAEKIVELIYRRRLEIFEKFKKQPAGGNWGNIKKVWFRRDGEVECADWTEIFFNGLKDTIREFYKKNLNSFRIEWRRIPPCFSHHGEHNYIRILGPTKNNYLVIDPWESGGKRIVPRKEKTSLAPWIGNFLYTSGDNVFAYPKADNSNL